MIDLRNVSLTYSSGHQAFCALDGINLSIRRGECLAVVGMSGSGKSSLIHVMSGLVKPTAGEVVFKGRPLSGPVRSISVIFQNYGLFPWKNVWDNLILPLRLRRTSVRKDEVEQIVALLGLQGHCRKYPSQLSGGQKQRVAIGRALLNEAEVILMDEPFSALDALSRERLQAFMMALFEKKRLTSVIVTHNIEEALLMGDRIAVFDHRGGRIVGLVDNNGRKAADFLESDMGRQRKKAVKRQLIGEQNEAQIHG